MLTITHDLGFVLFLFHDPPTTEIYTLSLHDALPIWLFAAAWGVRAATSGRRSRDLAGAVVAPFGVALVLLGTVAAALSIDRKSTRLNSSHANISYAVFCLKKKKNK